MQSPSELPHTVQVRCLFVTVCVEGGGGGEGVGAVASPIAFGCMSDP